MNNQQTGPHHTWCGNTGHLDGGVDDCATVAVDVADTFVYVTDRGQGLRVVIDLSAQDTTDLTPAAALTLLAGLHGAVLDLAAATRSGPPISRGVPAAKGA